MDEMISIWMKNLKMKRLSRGKFKIGVELVLSQIQVQDF
jgi:hypothetical protein